MKYTFKKIGAALLGLTLAITSLTGCGAKNAAQDTQAPNSTESVVYRTVDEIKESGTINIGVFSDKSPFGYVDATRSERRRSAIFSSSVKISVLRLIMFPPKLQTVLSISRPARSISSSQTSR